MNGVCSRLSGTMDENKENILFIEQRRRKLVPDLVPGTQEEEEEEAMAALREEYSMPFLRLYGRVICLLANFGGFIGVFCSCFFSRTF